MVTRNGTKPSGEGVGHKPTTQKGHQIGLTEQGLPCLDSRDRVKLGVEMIREEGVVNEAQYAFREAVGKQAA